MFRSFRIAKIFLISVLFFFKLLLVPWLLDLLLLRFDSFLKFESFCILLSAIFIARLPFQVHIIDRIHSLQLSCSFFQILFNFILFSTFPIKRLVCNFILLLFSCFFFSFKSSFVLFLFPFFQRVIFFVYILRFGISCLACVLILWINRFFILVLVDLPFILVFFLPIIFIFTRILVLLFLVLILLILILLVNILFFFHRVFFVRIQILVLFVLVLFI